MTDNTTVDNLLAQMSLAEKIGQMTQVEKNSITPEDVTKYFIGSILSGGGGNPDPNTPQNWAAMVKSFADAALETRLKIPLIYGTDAVHGHSNMREAVLFPHNIGLGATRDAELVERIGHITALEMLAVNVHWTFAPAVSVPQDIRWGRAFEGYSEDTELVTELSLGLLRGLHKKTDKGQWVLPSVKHYVGDGGTAFGTVQTTEWITASNWQAVTEEYMLDQGDTQIDEEELREKHLAPYIKAIEAGALNIMVSFSSWNGQKMHAHKYLLTDVLKGELGFEGFLVSDWAGVDQVDEDYYTAVVKSINAGMDMVMLPYNYERFIEAMTEAVESGDIPMERIDDAVRRILKVKQAVGLFEQPYGDESLLELVGCDEHRAVAREAVQKSLVLLKNEGDILPLSKDIDSLLVAGRHADDVGLQCGGWSIHWLGGSGEITPGTTILQGIREAISDNTELIYDVEGNVKTDNRIEVGIVIVGEEPYAEGKGDREDVRLNEDDIALIERVRARVDKLIVVLIAGRPIVINDQEPMIDAFVVAWLPGTEGNGVSDVLFGDVPFTGKLPVSYPRTMYDVPLSALKENNNGALWEFGAGL